MTFLKSTVSWLLINAVIYPLMQSRYRTFLSFPKGLLCFLAVSLLLSTPSFPSPWPPFIWFLSLHFWNHRICGLSSLASFTKHNDFHICPRCLIYQELIPSLSSIQVHLFTSWWRSGFFPGQGCYKHSFYEYSHTGVCVDLYFHFCADWWIREKVYVYLHKKLPKYFPKWFPRFLWTCHRKWKMKPLFQPQHDPKQKL